MKSSELRIGNLIRWDLNDPRSDDDFDYGYDECPISLWQLSEPDRISPIPLTEEWLVKFGFITFPSKNIFSEWFLNFDGVLKYKIYQTDFKGYNEFSMPHHDKPIKIEFVHQLQNLYFALTGEELTIK